MVYNNEYTHKKEYKQKLTLHMFAWLRLYVSARASVCVCVRCVGDVCVMWDMCVDSVKKV